MKILVISNMYPSPAHPAFGVFVQRITQQQADSGADITLLARRADGNKLWGYLAFYWRAFWSVLLSRHDLVYVHFASHSFPPVGMALLFRRLPLVVHVHGADVVPENPASKLRALFLRVFSGWALRRATLVVAPSEYFRREVCARFPVAAGKVMVSPSGGVDVQRFYNSALPAGRRRILFLGRLIAGKGVLQVMPALQLLRQRRPDLDFSLVFAGDGPLGPALREKAAELLPGVSVEFLGNVSPADVPAVIAGAHMLLFPSFRRGESLGLVVLEAMACGRPVIAARSGAMDELVAEGRSGLKFEAGNIQEMSEAVEKMLACDAVTLAAMGTAARTFAETYSSATVSLALHGLLQDLLAGRVRQAAPE